MVGTAIDLSEIKRYEVTEVYSDPEAIVDIVLVHGLNGHPRHTWTTPASKKSKKEVFWPTDLLPTTLKSAKARILVYGYNADVYAFAGSASSDMMHQHAQTLLANLSSERKLEERSDVPIIWVAHSLGGILVKRALCLSSDLTSKSADDKRSIFVSTYGVIFLGTPHTGADGAKWGNILQSLGDALIPKKLMDTDPTLLNTLMKNNETLQNINVHFLDICHNFEMNMVHEAMKTDMGSTKAFVVDQESASPLLPNVSYYGIEATHSGMCKFETKNSPGFTNVSAMLKTWVTDSPSLIRSRHEFEVEARKRTRENQMRELMGSIPTANPKVPDVAPTQLVQTKSRLEPSEASIEPEKDMPAPFIIPPGFRPNSVFIGREAQMRELHRTLFDKKRRAEGTSACLLHCLPGGGKSALAREYMYTHIDDFPGGVFWINAKSQEQLELGFWDIYRRVVIKSEDTKFSPSSTVEDLTQLSQNPHEFVDLVTKWFKDSHQWLLVFDGIHFSRPDILLRFIPDSINCSIIYTSTERSVSRDYHYMNPQVISIPRLSPVEAQKLFIQELDRKIPSRTDLQHSMDLVQLMECNPLVIHTIAQRLKKTREPLAKFARSYAAEPILRGLEAYKAVIDELKQYGAIEALNLMNVLCFFSQSIPVEMISLGIKSLDVSVRATEPDTGTSLNNTFMVLNSFALIERNEPEDSSSSSQSSRSSRINLPETIDILRIHSVVQDFFVDCLRASRDLSEWLSRAVKVFCVSYDRAVAVKGPRGLVADWRQYNVHAVRLLYHAEKIKKFDAAVKGQLLATHQKIQEQIEGRTPSSSRQLTERPLQVSVFDRTSSSSDTGPPTPGDQTTSTRVLSWGFGSIGPQATSPPSNDVSNVSSNFFPRPPLPIEPVPPRELPDDIGYDAEDDLALSEGGDTVRGADWQTVGPRRGSRKQKPAKLLLHRTIKAMDRTRYRDTVGAWRSIITDPRVRNIAVHGTFRTQSRERSSAEETLGAISARSPPPIRGRGTFITERRPSFTRPRTAEARPRTLVSPSYATAAAGFSPPTESIHPQLALSHGSGEGSKQQPSRPIMSAALTSLRRIPTLKTVRAEQKPESMAPSKPPPPSFGYQLPYPTSQTSLPQPGPAPEQEAFISAPANGRTTQPISYERAGSVTTAIRRRAAPYEYSSWSSQSPPQTTSSSPGPAYSNLTSPYLPTRSPDENAPFTAARCAKMEHQNHPSHGYTSEPMSRNPSGQSGATNVTSILEKPFPGHRHPSLAETEPSPRTYGFSPPSTAPVRRSNIPGTSFYEQRAEVGRYSGSDPRRPSFSGSALDMRRQNVSAGGSDLRRPSIVGGPEDMRRPSVSTGGSYVNAASLGDGAKRSPRISQATGVDWASGERAGASRIRQGSSNVPRSFQVATQRSNPISRAHSPHEINAPIVRGDCSTSSLYNMNSLAFSSVGTQFPEQRAPRVHSQSEQALASTSTAPDMGRNASGGIMVGENRFVGFGEFLGLEIAPPMEDTGIDPRSLIEPDFEAPLYEYTIDRGRGVVVTFPTARAANMPRIGSEAGFARYAYGPATERFASEGSGAALTRGGGNARDRSTSNPERMPFTEYGLRRIS